MTFTPGTPNYPSRTFAVVVGALFSVPAASALSLSTPSATSPGSIVREFWTTEAGDATHFTLFLVNTETSNQYVIVDDLSTTAEQPLEFEVPNVPAS